MIVESPELPVRQTILSGIGQTHGTVSFGGLEVVDGETFRDHGVEDGARMEVAAIVTTVINEATVHRFPIDAPRVTWGG